jgi:hypothetical protein
MRCVIISFNEHIHLLHHIHLLLMNVALSLMITAAYVLFYYDDKF